ncbi:MAG: glucose-6-phosphate isomerase [bacterium]|nr:glucose-6-phosphate isomerase [bacterium]
MIKIDDTNIVEKINYKKYAKKVEKINQIIETKSGPGNDYLGWLNNPTNTKKTELEEIKKHADYVRKNFDILLVCGIGGSYLGARASIEAINGLHKNKKPEIIFIGQSFSSDYLNEVIEYVKNKKFAINVISKSGTTTETSISFRIFKNLLEKKVGKEEAKKAIFATTDKEKGSLLKLANQEGYVKFVLPSDIGGRFSVFSPVGLFPIACAGIDIEIFIEGARKAQKELTSSNIEQNAAYKYAVLRDFFLKRKYANELFVTYEPRLVSLGEWFKQLFGESEGKEHSGLFPCSATFSTDLHSLGQFIQEGTPVLFETILNVKHPNHEISIPKTDDDLDELNYLAGKNLSFVSEQAFKGTLEAHSTTAKVPNIVLEIEKLDEEHLGYLFYFFMKTCAMSAYLLKVNPFNQPGVEVYKKNMFHLLGKKGY